MELQLIKSLMDRDVYDLHRKDIKPEHFPKEKRSLGWQVLEQLDTYFKHAEDSIDVASLETLHLNLPMDDKKKAKFKDFYGEIEALETTSAADALFRQFKETTASLKVEELVERREFEKAIDVLEALRKEEDEEDTIFMDFDLTKYQKEEDEGLVMRFSMPNLRHFVPKLIRGATTLILARTNAGKSSFAIPQAKAAIDGGFRVMHIALSEDTVEDLEFRYISYFLERSEQQCKDNSDVATKVFKERYGDRLKSINTGDLHYSRIEQAIKEFKPDLVIYDQYQKVQVKPNTQASGVEILVASSKKIKSMAKIYNHHAICVTQADANSGWVVTEKNIDGSKTGVPGEFRTIIGIGSPEIDNMVQIPVDTGGNVVYGLKRNINIAKNKGKMGMFTTYLDPVMCKWYEEKQL